MNCAEIETTDVDERYLIGTLSGEEQEVYEAHFFGCDRCFRRTRESARIARRSGARGRHDQTSHTGGPQSVDPGRGHRGLAAGGGIGLSLFLSRRTGDAGWRNWRSIEAPSYEPVQLRGASEPRPGQPSAGRWGSTPPAPTSEALPDLEAAAALEPGSSEFFLSRGVLADRGTNSTGYRESRAGGRRRLDPLPRGIVAVAGARVPDGRRTSMARGARLQQLVAIDGDLGSRGTPSPERSRPPRPIEVSSPVTRGDKTGPEERMGALTRFPPFAQELKARGPHRFCG